MHTNRTPFHRVILAGMLACTFGAFAILMLLVPGMRSPEGQLMKWLPEEKRVQKQIDPLPMKDQAWFNGDNMETPDDLPENDHSAFQRWKSQSDAALPLESKPSPEVFMFPSSQWEFAPDLKQSWLEQINADQSDPQLMEHTSPPLPPWMPELDPDLAKSEPDSETPEEPSAMSASGVCNADEYCSQGIVFDMCPLNAYAGLARPCLDGTGICYRCTRQGTTNGQSGPANGPVLGVPSSSRSSVSSAGIRPSGTDGSGGSASSTANRNWEILSVINDVATFIDRATGTRSTLVARRGVVSPDRRYLAYIALTNERMILRTVATGSERDLGPAQLFGQIKFDDDSANTRFLTYLTPDHVALYDLFQRREISLDSGGGNPWEFVGLILPDKTSGVWRRLIAQNRDLTRRTYEYFHKPLYQECAEQSFSEGTCGKQILTEVLGLVDSAPFNKDISYFDFGDAHKNARKTSSTTASASTSSKASVFGGYPYAAGGKLPAGLACGKPPTGQCDRVMPLSRRHGKLAAVGSNDERMQIWDSTGVRPLYIRKGDSAYPFTRAVTVPLDGYGFNYPFLTRNGRFALGGNREIGVFGLFDIDEERVIPLVTCARCAYRVSADDTGRYVTFSGNDDSGNRATFVIDRALNTRKDLPPADILLVSPDGKHLLHSHTAREGLVVSIMDVRGENRTSVDFGPTGTDNWGGAKENYLAHASFSQNGRFLFLKPRTTHTGMRFGHDVVYDLVERKYVAQNYYASTDYLDRSLVGVSPDGSMTLWATGRTFSEGDGGRMKFSTHSPDPAKQNMEAYFRIEDWINGGGDAFLPFGIDWQLIEELEMDYPTHSPFMWYSGEIQQCPKVPLCGNLETAPAAPLPVT